MKLEGVYSVLPTPFLDNGDFDEASLRRVVDLFIGAGVSGVTALGVTGEVARLEEPERARVLEVVVDQVKGRVGVVAGTSADGTRTCISYSRLARECGATAVMVSPPRMAKLNSDAVMRHYVALAGAVDIEIVVQDYPPISGFAMEPSLLARIAKEISKCEKEIGALDKKLGNADFLSRAPEEVVAEIRARLVEEKQRMKLLVDALETLGVVK